MNYWEEKIEFWRNKTKDNAIYEKQKAELVADILPLIRDRRIKRVIDVGGYKGIVGTYLPDGIEYINLDFTAGIDITKPWKGQKGLKDFWPEKNTLIITSLTLFCIAPEDMHYLLKEIRNYGSHYYFYEEATDTNRHDGDQINDDYGGKWNYDWERLIEPWARIRSMKPSEVNPKWVRMFAEEVRIKT